MAARKQLIRHLIEFTNKTSDEVYRAAGAGWIASTLCTSELDLDTARELLAQARASVGGIGSAADQCFIVECLLPAMGELAPEAVMPELERIVGFGPAVLEHGSLMKNPCIRLLERWQPWVGQQREQATALLLRFAELYLEDPVSGYVGSALAAIVPHLCKLGLTSAALELIDRCQDASAVGAARTVVNRIDELLVFAPDRVAGWLDSAKKLTDLEFHDMPINRHLFAESVTGALAAAGDWDAALELAETLPVRECADALVDLLRRAAAKFGSDAAARGKVIDRIMGVAGRTG